VAGGLDLAELFLFAGGAQFLGDVFGRPGGLGFVGAAPGEELAVAEAAYVDALDVGHGRERGMPFGAGLGERGSGLGPDRLAGVVPAEYLAVCAELPGLGLPLGPLVRVGGSRSEGLGGPQRAFVRGVLADAALPVVHRRGHLNHVPAELRIGELRQSRCPGRPGSRRPFTDQGADPGI
jgi:hypothetical protein